MGKLLGLYFDGGNITDALDCDDSSVAETLCYEYCQTNVVVSYNKKLAKCWVNDITTSTYPVQVDYDYTTYLHLEVAYGS